MCPFSTVYYSSSFLYSFTIQHTRYTNDCLKLGPPTFSWQRATPVITRCFGGHTYSNNNKCYNQQSKVLCKFVIYTQFANVLEGRIIQADGPQVEYQRSNGKRYSTLFHAIFSSIISCWFCMVLYLLCEKTAWDLLQLTTVYLGA